VKINYVDEKKNMCYVITTTIDFCYVTLIIVYSKHTVRSFVQQMRILMEQQKTQMETVPANI